uniref:NADH-ubiquinone oxidoreductase chain 4L n=1 Tax=Trioza anthrisci TaxID=2023874 RepID=A0A344A2T2_9HEMI|nr:NADH dehydrogenase subunit 4L [Trioza anthrisci]AWU49073.1 NADH dehydrogenase subunit 4L [Trioza anthrisci]
MLIYFSSLFMFYFGMLTYFLMKKHVLMMLLSLEFLSLILLLMIINFLTVFMYDNMMIIYFIITMVCEAVMGLIMLTLMVRTHGSDYLKSSILLSC